MDKSNHYTVRLPCTCNKSHIQIAYRGKGLNTRPKKRAKKGKKGPKKCQKNAKKSQKEPKRLTYR